MFVYNITVKVDNNIEEEWLRWQKGIHIPEILSTGFFYDHHFFKLLEQNQDEVKTYIIQYFSLERKDYEEYIHLHAPVLREKAFPKMGKSIYCI
jgi:hypothetical protein